LALDRSVQALKKADRHWCAAWPLFDGLVFDRESLRPELLEVKRHLSRLAGGALQTSRHVRFVP